MTDKQKTLQERAEANLNKDRDANKKKRPEEEGMSNREKMEYRRKKKKMSKKKETAGVLIGNPEDEDNDSESLTDKLESMV